MVILAIGQAPDRSFLEDSGIRCSNEGFIYANETTLATTVPGVFAGGDALYGPKSVIDALASGKKAAISIDRYIKGEDLAIGREGEGAVESNLKVSIEGVSQKQRIGVPTLPLEQRRGNFREVESGFTPEKAIEEAERCLACECNLCVKDCEFLKLYGEAPRELAERFKAGYFRETPKVPYSCNLCSLCKGVCPQDLCIGDACLELRHKLVEEGLGPLPQHKFIDWNIDWTTSDSFVLAQPDPETGECKRVFFPGCSLSGYSPSLVIKTYDFLRERLPGTGILLHCCGAPRRDLGQRDQFEKILDGVRARMAELGASEVIVPCANCYKSFKYFAPQLKVRSLYEVMAELGLPDGIKTKPWTFTLYDPCSARWEKDIQESVRTLARMTGYEMEEMEHSGELTRCCGTGGMVPYADISLAFKVTKCLADEAHSDIVTYCATCREMLANPEAAGKPTLHILDLIFNPDWEQSRLNPPCIGTTRRDNQAELKKLLLARASAG
jgi:Fe-S oxidoreductase